jgi:hypothetical protein
VGVTPGRAVQRFPGYDVVAEAGGWDAVTRRVVLARLREPGPLTFFTPEEAAVAGPLLDRLLAQDGPPKVPVLEPIDRRLANGEGDGFRYADLPEDAEAWRLSLRAIDEDARERYGTGFGRLTKDRQLRLIEDVRTTKEPWHDLPGARVFSLWVRYACETFYAHPWVWNEIGFGGPAYPRGYKNLGVDRREPWEVAEHEAADPIPWIRRAEDARKRHADAMSEPPDPVELARTARRRNR